MTEKRYAIVRIDNNCPMWTEKFNSFTCEDMFRCSRLWQIGQDTKCRDFCRYGDTKEQLISKVAQAIKRKLKGGLILRNTKINETYNIQKTISAKAVAKEIVEFLGVAE